MLVGVGLPNAWGMYGYIFIAFAGACVAAERFFCFTSHWRRSVVTSFDLQIQLQQFHSDWAALRINNQREQWTPEIAACCLKMISDFEKSCSKLMHEETEAFFDDFEGVMVHLERRIAAQRDASSKTT